MPELESAHSVEMPDEPIFDVASMGGGLRLKMRKTVELTPEFAEKFLEFVEFPGDRPLMESHVVFLTRQMESGTFRWEQVNFATCTCEGREYRMNGQHCAWARITANLPSGTRTPVQSLKYEADTYNDMRQLYATIDRGKARNMGNIVISYLADRAEFPNFRKVHLRMLAEGLALWKWESSAVRKLHTGDERSFLMLNYHYDVTLKVGEFIRHSETADFKHLKRSPVVAAMFATYNVNPKAALEFWAVVRDGIGVEDKTDPRHTLRNLLLTATVSWGYKTTEESLGGSVMYNACILAWNYFRGGKKLPKINLTKLDTRIDPR